MLDRLRNAGDIIAVFLIDLVVITFFADRYGEDGLLLSFGFFMVAFLAGWFARQFTLRRSP
jgi:hypothetical protein